MDTFYYGLSRFQKCHKKRLEIPTSVLVHTDTPAYQLCHRLSMSIVLIITQYIQMLVSASAGPEANTEPLGVKQQVWISSVSHCKRRRIALQRGHVKIAPRSGN